MSSQLPAAIAEKLLDELSTDDAFRDLFEKNPRAALKQIGYETPAADRGWKGRDPVLPFYHLQGGLADKKKLAAGREAMLAAFQTTDAAKPAALTASRTGGAPAPLPFGPFVLCCDE